MRTSPTVPNMEKERLNCMMAWGTKLEARQAEEAGVGWMSRIALRLRALLFAYDFEFCELISGLALAGWGVWLMLPWDTFGTSAIFSGMQRIGPEWAWGLAGALLGALQLLALLSDRWQTSDAMPLPAHHARKIACQLAGAFWLFLWGFLASGNFRSLGTVTYMVLALTSVWAYLRLSVRSDTRWTRY